MTINELCDALAATGTGREKLNVIRAALCGQPLTPETVETLLRGCVADITIQKALAIVRQRPNDDES